MGVSEDTKCGLYSKASPCLNAIDNQYISKIDIEQVNINLMKTEEHVSTYHLLQKRVMTNFTKEACGRVEEVKFQKYPEQKYNNYFKCLEWRWFDMKTLDKYTIRMAPQMFSFDL